MQPLYSVDHESRHNSNHVEVDSEAPSPPAENTPLLQRFPRNDQPRNPFTTIIVSVLLVILIVGVIIGIYLLVLQDESENILPPVESALEIVRRSQWDRSNLSPPLLKSTLEKCKQVVVVQTNTNECNSTEACTKLLHNLQANVTAAKDVLPYNFLVSSGGQTFEALGWQPLMSIHPPINGLVLAFIGNFSRVAPSRLQAEAAKNFLAESVSRQYLDPSYRIIGKNANDTPMYLSESLRTFPQWSNELADDKTK